MIDRYTLIGAQMQHRHRQRRGKFEQVNGRLLGDCHPTLDYGNRDVLRVSLHIEYSANSYDTCSLGLHDERTGRVLDDVKGRSPVLELDQPLTLAKFDYDVRFGLQLREAAVRQCQLAPLPGLRLELGSTQTRMQSEPHQNDGRHR